LHAQTLVHPAQLRKRIDDRLILAACALDHHHRFSHYPRAAMINQKADSGL